MSSIFEKEFAANAVDLGIDASGKSELLKKARTYCSKLAEAFSRSETAANAVALAEGLLVRSFKDNGFVASQVAKTFCAMRAIDKESGAARGDVFADLTSDAAFFATAKRRGGVSASFALSDRDVSRMRAMVQ